MLQGRDASIPRRGLFFLRLINLLSHLLEGPRPKRREQGREPGLLLRPRAAGRWEDGQQSGRD